MESANQRQFRIHDCLGRGGFGEVYRATMLSPGGLKTKVAVKVLRIDVDPGGDAVNRLRDEGRLLAALRHPSILRAYDLALLDGRIGLVTEFVDGLDLHQCIGDIPDPLPPRAAVQVAGTVADALSVAWSGLAPEGDKPLHLVHRDIKPSNIRLGLHGEVKLLDFGIARSDEVDREARTGTGSTVGSLAYMAPERFSRVSPGPEADIYALGCALYEALAGRRLHEDAVPVEMFRLSATQEAHHRHVEESLQELPERLAPVLPVLRSMLAHDRSARPLAAQVARECEDLAEALPGKSLKRWARERNWPPPDPVQGAFDGRTITEGTLSKGMSMGFLSVPEAHAETYRFDVSDSGELTMEETAEAVRAAAAPPPPTPRWPLYLVIGVLLLMGVGIAGYTFGAGTTPREPTNGVTDPRPTVPEPLVAPTGPDPVQVPADPDPVAPVPTEPEPVEPNPTEPEPAEPAPAEPEPAEPEPAEPEPAEPEPAEPEPAAVEMGTVSINKVDYAVTLSNAQGTFGAGQVPVGTYEIRVNGARQGTISVAPGITTTLYCNALTFSCSQQ